MLIRMHQLTLTYNI